MLKTICSSGLNGSSTKVTDDWLRCSGLGRHSSFLQLACSVLGQSLCFFGKEEMQELQEMRRSWLFRGSRELSHTL